MYHNIVPALPTAGDRSLHLSRADFARQLDHLQSACDVVPLEALIEGPPRSGARCRVAITFDDAYLGAVSLGVNELVGRGLPATLFVPPGLLGQETWWDVLAASPGGMTSEQRAEMLRDFKGQAGAIEGSPQWHVAARSGSLEPELRITDAAGLTQAAAQPHITIASHTWSHPNLAAIGDGPLDEELGRSLNWLRDRFVSFRPYISYPYGLSSPRVAQAAARAGYRAALLADGGWLPGDVQGNRYALPRFDVSAGLSFDGFLLRLAGFGLAGGR
jgi:peptidoglycan/xylan/chitin deacetylase (PgdA/CDA1 family)